MSPPDLDAVAARALNLPAPLVGDLQCFILAWIPHLSESGRRIIQGLYSADDFHLVRPPAQFVRAMSKADCTECVCLMYAFGARGVPQHKAKVIDINIGGKK